MKVIENQRIVLTGGAGFIGSKLAERLVDANRVVVFDNGHRDSLTGTTISAHPNLEMVRGDVLDVDSVRRVVSGADSVVHLAAIAGVDTVLKMPVTTMHVNIIGTFNVLQAAKECADLKRFVDFSTSEVFGSYAYKVREGDITSLGAVGEARWTYAVSKLATEHLAHNYYKQYGLPSVSIRPFNIYGPGQVGEGAIHRFIVQALRREDLSIHNDGSQIRAWCYVDDMVDGILAALERPEAVGHAFNIGNPRSVVTIHNLAIQVARLAAARLAHRPRSVEQRRCRTPDPRYRQGTRAARLRAQGRPRGGPPSHHRVVSTEHAHVIRLARPEITEDDIEAVAAVLRTGHLVQGREVAAFEAELARYVGAPEAVAVGSCTSALHLALLALGVGPGDAVVVPAYSWPATANVVAVCGATPVFADIEHDTMAMCPDALAATLRRRVDVKAVMPVHPFGGLADMRAIGQLAAARGVAVIEDAACALGSSLDDRPAGTWGVMGCFSFHPRKTITTGEGGAITTSDGTLAAPPPDAPQSRA